MDLAVKFEDFGSSESFLVLDMDKYDLILGMPWLEKHEPWIDWRGKAIGASRPAVSDRALVCNVPTSVQAWGARDGRQGVYAPEEVLGVADSNEDVAMSLAPGHETKAHCQACGVATAASPNAESRRAVWASTVAVLDGTDQVGNIAPQTAEAVEEDAVGVSSVGNIGPQAGNVVPQTAVAIKESAEGVIDVGIVHLEALPEASTSLNLEILSMKDFLAELKAGEIAEMVLKPETSPEDLNSSSVMDEDVLEGFTKQRATRLGSEILKYPEDPVYPLVKEFSDVCPLLRKPYGVIDDFFAVEKEKSDMVRESILIEGGQTAMEVHLKHLRRVFEVMRANKLYANIDKCVFAAEEIKVLGSFVSRKDDEGHERVISFQSRQQKAAERNYPVHDKELLAMKVKPSGHASAPLQSLPVPADCWKSMSLDFVFGLPADDKGNTGILVFVCRLSKMVHLAPVRDKVTGKQAAQLFLDSVFRYHGLPETIVSDRDPRFTGAFWDTLFQLLGTKLTMSTADHPQTDGQTEHVNRVLEATLRSICAEAHLFWSEQQHEVVSSVEGNNLKHRFIGPFTVLASHGVAYTIDFPKSMVTHLTLYAGRLKRYHDPLGPSPRTEEDQDWYPGESYEVYDGTAWEELAYEPYPGSLTTRSKPKDYLDRAYVISKLTDLVA
ncbi:RNA-directed DNA polymerase [Phytophthora palmivora]|uniref:RNA-directed DNA polymerase n=1 Tax=Phytophthora palmivora TaxID=4796 RepID=A0A2P4YM70_9STRA|nr:RNA-directed DNA polymerase [Phytophthora palmivora]